jgi:hypothetical protein
MNVLTPAVLSKWWVIEQKCVNLREIIDINRTGPSREACRYPIELSTSESIKPIFTSLSRTS